MLNVLDALLANVKDSSATGRAHLLVAGAWLSGTLVTPETWRAEAAALSGKLPMKAGYLCLRDASDGAGSALGWLIVPVEKVQALAFTPAPALEEGPRPEELAGR